MKPRYRVMGLVMAGSAAALAVALSKEWAARPVPEALATAGDWTPGTLATPPVAVTTLKAMVSSHRSTSPAIARPPVPYLASPRDTLSAARPPLTTWSRIIAPGETLDALLKEARMRTKTYLATLLATNKNERL